MKFTRIFVLPALALLFMSCATVGLQSKIQKLSVGMSRQQVVNTLGNQYEIVHSVLTPDGDTVEILLYTDPMWGDRYECELHDGRLVRFSKVYDAPETNHDHPRRHRH